MSQSKAGRKEELGVYQTLVITKPPCEKKKQRLFYKRYLAKRGDVLISLHCNSDKARIRVERFYYNEGSLDAYRDLLRYAYVLKRTL